MITEGLCFFSLKPFVVTTHLNLLDEMVQMVHNIHVCFYAE